MLNTATVPIIVPAGGTGIATGTNAYVPICTGTTATGAFQPVASAGTSGQLYTSNGASSLPTFKATAGAVQIATATPSNAASVSFTSLTGYTNYLILCNNFVPVTNATSLQLQMSNNGGSSYTSGSTDYRGNRFATANMTLSQSGNYTASQITLSTIFSNTSTVAASFNLWIFKPGGSEYTTVFYQPFYVDDASNYRLYMSGGQCTAITAINAIQFTMSSGNISTGNFQLYGLP
jgi:hypothetical protein